MLAQDCKFGKEIDLELQFGVFVKNKWCEMTIKKNPTNDLEQQFENLVQNDPKERLQNVQRNYS